MRHKIREADLSAATSLPLSGRITRFLRLSQNDVKHLIGGIVFLINDNFGIDKLMNEIGIHALVDSWRGQR